MRVFLSHHSRLKPALREVKADLPSFLHTWLDDEALCWGDELAPSLEEAILQQVEFLIVFVEADTLQSEWVRKELDWALERERILGRPFILPVFLGPKPPSIPPYLTSRIYLECASYGAADLKHLALRMATGLFQIVAKAYDELNGAGETVRRNSKARAQNCFSGASIHECHQQMFEGRSGLQDVVNFSSAVPGTAYVHPPTTRIGSRHATEDEVIASFTALHPEYDKKQKAWPDERKIRAILSSLPRRFRIQHGPRMFAATRQNGEVTSSISAALEKLGSHPSRAYIGLEQREDLASVANDPPPGLVGVQFVATTERKLTVIAHFRHIELSFWWAVNMYEMIALQEWALEHRRDSLVGRGEIIFQSSCASWRESPRALFDSPLDVLPFGELLEMVLRVSDYEVGARQDLAALLELKADHISEYNIDCTGLSRLLDIVVGVQRLSLAKGTKCDPFVITLAASLPRVVETLNEATLEHKLSDVRTKVKDSIIQLRAATASL